MMRSYEGPAPAAEPRPRVYHVIRSPQGWRVEINGCVTRALADRKAADRLARALQRERDGLTHRRGPIQ